MNTIRQPNVSDTINTERMLAAALRLACLMTVFWISLAVYWFTR